jgi:hypothetical protein
MLFVLNIQKSTIDKGGIKVYVYNQKKEAADCKKSDKNIEPTLISTCHLHHRQETIPKARRIEEIRKDPDVIVENYHQQVNCQSYHQNSNNSHQQN